MVKACWVKCYIHDVRHHLAILQSDVQSDPRDLCCQSCVVAKWPKQNMPRVSDLLTSIAILKHIAFLLNEPVYIMATDFKNFFNQLKLTPQAYWKCNMILANLTGPVYAAEYIMIFGLRPASGTAQRFAEAILFIFNKRLSEAAIYLTPTSSAFVEWKASRSSPEQARLHDSFIYCDDPVIVTVGARLSALAYRVLEELMDELGLLMATAEKRQCVQHLQWNGTGIASQLGFGWIAKAKLMSRSRDENRTCNRLRFRLVFLVLDETAPECDSASICRSVVLVDVNYIQNERHRRIRGLRLAYRKTSAAR